MKKTNLFVDFEKNLLVMNSKILLISKYALERKQYNTIDADVTWETCTTQM